jgi:copper chaperone NosL
MRNLRVRARLLLLAAALLLVPAWTLPLWSIQIVAPQYNDGLGMYIGARDIVGHTEHDIQNINILNHYIGMRPIVPAEVSPLEVMPVVLLFLMGAAVAAALVGRRWAVGAWLACFTIAGIAGLYEFHSWNYDYGHNLSPDAPIKVPGMTYQPPLIGTKTLLTIRASSYPSWGTLFVLLSFLAGGLAFAMLTARSRAALARVAGAFGGVVGGAFGMSQRQQGRAAVLLLAATATLAAAGCAPRPAEPAMAAGVEFAPDMPACDYCDGVIPDVRFGGEIVTRSGERFRFMSAECMAAFVAAGRVAEQDIRSMQVVDYTHGERLIDARSAHYVRSALRQSPSGLNVLAAETEKVAYNLHFFFHGTRMTWPEVVELVREEWAI